MYGKGEEGESWRKKETDGRNERTEPKVKGTWRREREGNRGREREKEKSTDYAARITGSILSCDSSRFDCRALVFAPLQVNPLYIPAAAPGDDPTPRPVTSRPTRIRIISSDRNRPPLPSNACATVRALRCVKTIPD